MLTFNQTAQLLGVSRKTLYKMIERQEITPAIIVTIGKQNRPFFNNNDVNALRQARHIDKLELTPLRQAVT